VNWATPFRLSSYRRLASLWRRTLHNQRRERIDFRSGLGEHAGVLYALVRAMRPDVCVEIGSARGQSTCSIGLALAENQHGKLYAIDPHQQTAWNDRASVDTYELIQNHLEVFGVRERVEIVRKLSHEAAVGWELPIDLLFLDGGHAYEDVKRDWDLFSPFVVPTGLVLFHDTAWELTAGQGTSARADMGVPRFVDELRKEGYPVLTLLRDYGLSMLQPVKGGLCLVNQPRTREFLAGPQR
jgi:predicted O-methyltransferase YrrM